MKIARVLLLSFFGLCYLSGIENASARDAIAFICTGSIYDNSSGSFGPPTTKILEIDEKCLANGQSAGDGSGGVGQGTCNLDLWRTSDLWVVLTGGIEINGSADPGELTLTISAFEFTSGQYSGTDRSSFSWSLSQGLPQATSLRLLSKRVSVECSLRN